MDWWIYLIAALNAIAAILALISKLWWTKFYRAAKEAQIEALMAQIEGLKQHNQNLREFNPAKILEFYKSAKILFEKQITSLEKDLEKAKAEIKVKERRIGKLREQREFHIAEFRRISQEKAELEKKAQNYNKRIIEVAEIGKEFDMASEQIVENFPLIINLTEKMFSEMVLILACITPERETIFDFLKEQLADYDYWSNPYDLSRPDIRKFIKANFMFGIGPKFIIVDLTNTDLLQQELAYILSEIPPTPIIPILQDKNFLDRFKIGFIKDSPHWILSPYCYRSLDKLAKSFESEIIVPAEAKAKELRDGKEMKFGEII